MSSNSKSFSQLEELESRLLLSDYFIATNGIDTNSGSEAAPFASMYKFFSVAQPGDTCYLRGGTYITSVVDGRGVRSASSSWMRLSPTASGTADAWITIRNYGDEEVIIDSALPGNDMVFVNLTNSNAFIKFQGLHVSNFRTPFNLDTTVGKTAPNNIVFEDMEISYCGTYGEWRTDGRGIKLGGGAHDITIRNSEFHHIAGPGVYGLGACSNILIENCDSHDNDDGGGTDGDADGFTFNFALTNGVATYADNVTFRNCRVWNCTEDGIDCKGDNFLVEGCTVWNTAANGFKAWSVVNEAVTPVVAYVQGRFTFRDCLAFDAGESILECFNQPDTTIERCTFIGTDNCTYDTVILGGETTFVYPLRKAYQSWQGKLRMHDSIMMHLGNTSTSIAAEFELQNMAVKDVDNNIYYSLHRPTQSVLTRNNGMLPGSTYKWYSNLQMGNGQFYADTGMEQNGQSMQVSIAPFLLETQFPQNIQAGQSQTFAATAVDPDHNTLTYSWDFGDGTDVQTGESVQHTYTADGTYALTLTVMDSSGESVQSVSEYILNTGNLPPVAVDDAITTPKNTPVAIAVRGNDSDPNGDTLSISAFTQGSHGAVTSNVDGTLRYTPATNWYGVDTFTYTVSDGRGGTDQATVQVTTIINNHAPTAGAVSFSTNENAALVIPASSLLANSSDSDGDTFTLQGVLATANTHGTVTYSNGNVTYTPTAYFNGTASFTFTIVDAYGATATGTATVNVAAVNYAPAAGMDTRAFTEDTSVTFNASTLTANDTDPDGDTLTVTSVVGNSNTHGSVALANGQITYTPVANYSGSGTFTYTISDGHGGTAIGMVSYSVAAANDAPVVVTDILTTPRDTSLVFNASALLANDTDVDGDTLSVTQISSASFKGGTVILSNGQITYAPAAGYSGNDSFSYTISDGHGGTAVGLVSVSVSYDNSDPVANLDTIILFGRAPVSVADSFLLSNDTDADDDALHIVSVIATRNTHGTVTYENGTITFTPNSSYHGFADFEYEIADDFGGSAVGTVQVGGKKITFNSSQKATYLSANMTLVTVSMTGPGSGELFFADDNAGDPGAIVLSDTTAKTAVTFTAGGAGTEVQNVQVNGSLKSFTGKGVDLAGRFAATGSIGSVQLRNVRSSDIDVNSDEAAINPKSRVKMTFDCVYDTRLDTHGVAVSTLAVSQWQDACLDASDEISDGISAMSIDTLTVSGKGRNSGVNGDFQADLALSGNPTASKALGTAKIKGVLSSSNVDIDGNVGSLSVGSVSEGVLVDVLGATNQIASAGYFTGTWAFGSVNTMSVALDMADADLSFRQAPDTRIDALKSLNVKHEIRNSHLTAAGNIGTISAGKTSDSEVFAGRIPVELNVLQSVSVDFAYAAAAIRNVNIRGINDGDFSTKNFNVSAPKLGNISLGLVQFQSDAPFGLTGKVLSKATWRGIGKSYSWSSTLAAKNVAVPDCQNFQIQLI